MPEAAARAGPGRRLPRAGAEVQRGLPGHRRGARARPHARREGAAAAAADRRGRLRRARARPRPGLRLPARPPRPRQRPGAHARRARRRALLRARRRRGDHARPPVADPTGARGPRLVTGANGVPATLETVLISATHRPLGAADGAPLRLRLPLSRDHAALSGLLGRLGLHASDLERRRLVAVDPRRAPGRVRHRLGRRSRGPGRLRGHEPRRRRRARRPPRRRGRRARASARSCARRWPSRAARGASRRLAAMEAADAPPPVEAVSPVTGQRLGAVPATAPARRGRRRPRGAGRPAPLGHAAPRPTARATWPARPRPSSTSSTSSPTSSPSSRAARAPRPRSWSSSRPWRRCSGWPRRARGSSPASASASPAPSTRSSAGAGPTSRSASSRVLGPAAEPFATPLGDVAVALTAGNGVVLKPSPHAALAGERIARIFARAGLPGGPPARRARPRRRRRRARRGARRRPGALHRLGARRARGRRGVRARAQAQRARARRQGPDARPRRRERRALGARRGLGRVRERGPVRRQHRARLRPARGGRPLPRRASSAGPPPCASATRAGPTSTSGRC